MKNGAVAPTSPEGDTMNTATEQLVNVGDGGTVCGWSDRHACTVIAVSALGKVVRVQRDKATRTDENGMSDRQTYTYERDTEGATYDFSLRKNGMWVEVGSPMRDGYVLQLGHRRSYYDFSF
jgi:hypothetical protein